MNKFLKFWLPVILWGGVIFSFSSQTTAPASNVYWQEFAIKKTAHMVVYGMLSALLYRVMRVSNTQKTSAIIAIIISALYGFTDEFHQSFTPGREPTLRDVFFDTIGAAATATYLWKLLPKAHPKLKNWAKKLDLL